MSMNENNMITISVEEYKRLLELSVRVGIFADNVNESRYSIGREECGQYLGFEVCKHDD